METLKIDQGIFLMAFERDVDYAFDHALDMYLDRKTGMVEWIYEEDDDAEMMGLSAVENRSWRKRLAAQPERFLLIPGLSHGEHHEILRDFLASDWTDDDALHESVRDAYRGSIGRWKQAVGDREVVHAYYRYQERRILEMAVTFLSENGIQVEWA